MNLDDVFKSNYLKASDLQGREPTVTISKYTMEKLGDDQKLVIYFQNKDKGMVCNKTNANRIAYYYTGNLDNWIGKQIILGTELVDFQGKSSEALRVKGKPATADTPAQAVKADAPFDGNDDTGIPF